MECECILTFVPDAREIQVAAVTDMMRVVFKVVSRRMMNRVLRSNCCPTKPVVKHTYVAKQGK